MHRLRADSNGIDIIIAPRWEISTTCPIDSCSSEMDAPKRSRISLEFWAKNERFSLVSME
jgi:hypothetical protein